MELRHLRYFVAVAAEENITRAAARLHVSQPPLTRQIQDLEHELGFALLTRAGKSIRLTEAGRIFADEARAVLARLETGVAEARKVAAGAAGELHVGYAPSPTITVLPRALERFQRERPGVRVTLHDLSTPQMLEGLRERRLHLALMMQPPKAALEGVSFEPLRGFPIVVAVARGHRLARKRAVTLQDIVGEPAVALARREYADYQALLARVLGARAGEWRIVEESDSGMSLIAAVEAGRGIALTISALRETAGARIRLVPLSPAPAPAMLGVAYLESALSPAARALLSAVHAVTSGSKAATR